MCKSSEAEFDDIDRQNQVEAKKLNPNVDCYPIPVCVTSVTPDAADPTNKGTITFSATGVGGVTVPNCTEVWGDTNAMWACPPSTLSPSPRPGTPGPLPAAGATGCLYLSVACVTRHGIPVPPPAVAPPKWPKYLAARRYEMLSIWPTRVEVTGIERATGDFKELTFNMLDPHLAFPGQTLMLNDEPLDLMLSVQVFADKVPFEPPAQFWPWTKLAAAVEDIEKSTDPRRRANALRIIAACIECVERDGEIGAVTVEQVEVLEGVLSKPFEKRSKKSSKRSKKSSEKSAKNR